MKETCKKIFELLENILAIIGFGILWLGFTIYGLLLKSLRWILSRFKK